MRMKLRVEIAPPAVARLTSVIFGTLLSVTSPSPHHRPGLQPDRLQARLESASAFQRRPVLGPGDPEILRRHHDNRHPHVDHRAVHTADRSTAAPRRQHPAPGHRPRQTAEHQRHRRMPPGTPSIVAFPS